ncbi:MAG: hypothetical protein J6Q48_09745 [Bacteroidaceae bacterium]|nr:hypothetical protein [Bacteroidaceae bacterium]
MDLKSFKKQAIAHWKDNLKRVKAMNWKEWKSAGCTTRRTVVFSTTGDKYPHIGGDECPYCMLYRNSCATTDIPRERCPLKQESVPGGCCVAWLNVREALIVPWSKEQAITAINAMIEYIKERG